MHGGVLNDKIFAIKHSMMVFSTDGGTTIPVKHRVVF